jgi:glutathione reductase (NADPH)
LKYYVQSVKTFDVVVIGTGSAAAGVATRCRSAGWQVAVIDSRPFGGTCALRGCDPKKVLVGAAEVIDWNRRMQGKGVRGEQARIEWPELMRFKRSFTGPVPQRREESFSRIGIANFHGRARFAGSNRVSAGEDVLEGRHVVVATGARPATLNIRGEHLLTTSDRFLELDELPSRIVFIGGGYIAFEFGHVAARAGAKVTILHSGAQPLNRFDPLLVDQLVRRTRDLGVDVQLSARAEAVEKISGGLRVSAGDRTFEARMVVHAAGRVPEIDDLDLPAAGVEQDRRGVKVNEYLQSVSNPVVYAAGDAAAREGPPLTPVAGYDGRIVATNLLEGNRAKASYVAVPSVCFSIPPIASVGLLEEEARRQGLRFRINYQNTSSWYSSRRVGEECSGFKVLVEESSERILGAHLLGHHVEEIINIFALAMRSGMRASDLREMFYAYPTHASDLPYMV